MNFNSMTDRLDEHVSAMGRSKSPVADWRQLPRSPGLYVFYEDGRPLYVGRSNNLRNRVQRHRTGAHNTAAFAVGMTRRRLRVERRTEEEKGDYGDEVFREAKERIKGMEMGTVKVECPIEQAALEMYAHMRLKTPYNDFDNH